MNFTNFPQLQVAWVKPETLTFYNRRTRRHTQAKLKKLRRSIAEFGWTQPLIIDENNMVMCGAGRLTIALEDRIDLVPVIRIDHMTDVQNRVCGSRPSIQATHATEIRIDLRCRGGIVTISSRLSPSRRRLS